MHPAGDQIVPCAFGRGLAEHGGLDVDKPIGIQKFTHLHGHAIAQHQIVLHVRTSQIQYAVGQARGFAQILVIELEWWCHRRVENGEFMAQHLNLAALEVVVSGPIRASPHQAFHLDTKLVANTLCRLEHVGTIRVAHHLDIAFAVTHVHKNHAAVVTTTVDPTTQGHGFAQQGFGHKTAIVRAHGHKKLSKLTRKGGTGN